MQLKFASLVTGGSRGIGKAAAIRLSKQGPVFIVGTNVEALTQTCLEINEQGGDADFFAGDVALKTTAQASLKKLKVRGWQVKNLVCAAGIGKSGRSNEYSARDWRRCFSVNVDGAFWFCQAVLPKMIENKSGNICLISSIAGIKGYKYQAAYTASKHALVGLAKSLALEFAKHGIVVVPICPAFVDTDMTKQTIAGLVKHRNLTEAAAREIIANVNPQKRIISADEVAEAVITVCSGRVSALNGHPIILSGGE